MLPTMLAGLPPPFYQLSPLGFQDLCRDLLAVQPGIARCDVYGTNGQKQYGIDLLAPREDRAGITVGQCKCYASFTEDDLIAATREFLDHREYWSGRDVRAFILFVACGLDRRQVQDEIPRQEQLFAAEGITYEVWSAATIRTRLGPHFDIVWRHTRSDHWVRDICGAADAKRADLPVSPQAPHLLDAALLAQNAYLSARLN